MIKNTAGQVVGVQMVSASDGSAFTGSVTARVTGDGGTQATGSVGSGACTHEGNGYHTYAPAQAETNYDQIGFTFTGTGAIPVTLTIYTVTGDAFARLGAPAGASVSADILAVDNLVDDLEARLTATRAGYLDNLSGGAAALEATAQAILTDTGTTLQGELDGIQADTEDIQSRLPAALVSGRIDASVGAMASNVMTAAAAASDLTTELQNGLATASALSTLTTTVGAAGAGLTAIPWNAAWDAEVESEVADALEATIADSVPADGSRPSVKQALYMLTQFMLERSVSTTTMTVKKPDGSTTLFTLTLNDATTPTSITRAS